MRSLMLGLVLALGACGAHGAHHGDHHGDHGKNSPCGEHCGDGCPMRQEGVQVVYEDTADGAAMSFTADADKVAELQARVAKMAEKHNEPHPHHSADHVAHSARADNTPTGAKLIMTPADPAALEAMRKHVREHVDQMQRGDCTMDCCKKPGA